jgi:DNA topoisomerase-1
MERRAERGRHHSKLVAGQPAPPGKWKAIVWEPDKMYVAKWVDKLTGKIKYVWFADSAFLKQKREEAKFQKAEELGRQINKVRNYILKNLNAENVELRKVATVCWLILEPNMRVGDEKDPVKQIPLAQLHLDLNMLK